MKRQRSDVTKELKTSISLINDDSLITIFSFLPLNDILKLSRTTKEFKYVIETNKTIWDQTCIKCKVNKNTIKNQFKLLSRVPLRKLIIFDMDRSFNDQYFKLLQNAPLKELTIHTLCIVPYFCILSNINKNELEKVCFNMCFNYFLKNFKNLKLKELTIQNCEFITFIGYEHIKNISCDRLLLKNINEDIQYSTVFENLNNSITYLEIDSSRYYPTISDNDFLLLHENIKTLKLKNFYNIFHFPKHIKKLILTSFSISSDNILKYIGECKNIEELECNDCELVRDDYEEINKLSTLRILKISHDDSFCHKYLYLLSDINIETLVLDECAKITNDIAVPLSEIKSLKHLCIQNSFISESFAKIISLLLPLKLLKITMAYGFNNRSLQYIKNMKTLEEFHLEHITMLDNESIVYLKEMSGHLKKLTISGYNKISKSNKLLYKHFLPYTETIFS